MTVRPPMMGLKPCIFDLSASRSLASNSRFSVSTGMSRVSGILSDIASHCYHRPPTEATKSALAAVARLAGLVAGLLVAAPVQSVLAGGSAVALEIDAKPVVFAPWQHERQTVGALEWRGGVELDGTSGDFGGYSGFVLSRDGRRLFAVSDRGTWLLADIAYEDGRLAGLSDGR